MMAILDSIKDPNTGKIKTPILISIIGAGGLLAYMFFKGGGSSAGTSSGQSSPMTPDLTGLQTALEALTSGGAASGGNVSGGGTVTPPTSGDSSYPSSPYISGGIAGDSGVAGGGGAGLGTVTTAISRDTAVYAGLATLSPKQQTAQMIDITTQLKQAGSTYSPQTVATIEHDVATYAQLGSLTPKQQLAYKTDLATLSKYIGTANATAFAAAVPKK